MRYFGMAARQTQRTLIACVLHSNALVNSPMKLIATFRCVQGVREVNCQRRSGEVLRHPAIIQLLSCFTSCPSLSLSSSHPLPLPFCVRQPLHTTLQELNQSLRNLQTCLLPRWHCCNVSDLDLLRINPSRHGRAGTPADSHAEHRHQPNLRQKRRTNNKYHLLTQGEQLGLHSLCHIRLQEGRYVINNAFVCLCVWSKCTNPYSQCSILLYQISLYLSNQCAISQN